MQPLVLYQLVVDRQQELKAAGSRRTHPVRPPRSRTAAGRARSGREWRALLRALQAR